MRGVSDAEIHLLHVRVVLDDPNVNAGILNKVEQILTASEPRIRQALEEARANGNARIHPPTKRGIIPADVIIGAMREYERNLVVLATRGLSSVTHELLGSVAERVTQQSEVPAPTVRE